MASHCKTSLALIGGWIAFVTLTLLEKNFLHVPLEGLTLQNVLGFLGLIIGLGVILKRRRDMHSMLKWYYLWHAAVALTFACAAELFAYDYFTNSWWDHLNDLPASQKIVSVIFVLSGLMFTMFGRGYAEQQKAKLVKRWHSLFGESASFPDTEEKQEQKRAWATKLLETEADAASDAFQYRDGIKNRNDKTPQGKKLLTKAEIKAAQHSKTYSRFWKLFEMLGMLPCVGDTEVPWDKPEKFRKYRLKQRGQNPQAHQTELAFS